MNKRHKHADVIIAWANGEAVQVRYPTQGEWFDVTKDPTWCEEWEYRVKPKPVIRKFRVAEFIDGSRIYTFTIDNEGDEAMCEKEADFVRWLSDWIEYEVSA